MNTHKVNIYLYLRNKEENQTQLFKKALNCAEHGHVLYITQTQMKQIPNDLRQSGLLNRHYLKKISFFYLNKLDSLINELSSIHEWQNTPRTIILDSLEEFASLEELQKSAAVVALLKDAVEGCAQQLQSEADLVISINSERSDIKHIKTLLDLYFFEAKINDCS